MLSTGVCATRQWQTSDRLVQELNVCTVPKLICDIEFIIQTCFFNFAHFFRICKCKCDIHNVIFFYNQLTTKIPHITVNISLSYQLRHFEVLLITFRSVIIVLKLWTGTQEIFTYVLLQRDKISQQIPNFIASLTFCKPGLHDNMFCIFLCALQRRQRSPLPRFKAFNHESLTNY